MRKMNISGKKVRSVCAAAMALTLAVPTTMYVKTTTVEASVLEGALVTYDFEEGTESLTPYAEKSLKFDESGKPVIENNQYVFEESTAFPEVKEDEKRGKVLEFKDSVKVNKYKKTEDDAKAAAEAEGKEVSEAALNIEYPVGTQIQTEEHVGGRLSLANPFKGMTFDETDENAGVSISYWVKVPVIQVDEFGEKVTDGSGEDRGANSTTVLFENKGRVVMNKDDMAKYLACKAYDEAKASNDTEALKDYDMGTQKVVTDKEGNAYVLYEGYGKLLRFNPDYPAKDAYEQAKAAVTGTGKAKEGGWYVPTNDKDAKIEVTDAQGNTYKISSLQNAGSTVEDENQYDLFRYHYAKEDDLANEKSSKSKIREEAIEGSLQISTDNDFGFREDNYRKEEWMENGEKKSEVVDGSKITNPNSDKYDTIQNLRADNMFNFDGDDFVTNLETGAEKWHYVTVVIQNDWVVTYVDGKAADPEFDYMYMREDENAMDFGPDTYNKMFNRGKGLRLFPAQASNIQDWPADGTANACPANALGITMLDWIADENTTLYFGGSGCAAEVLTQGYGTKEGVCLDDVSFFGKALTEEEAKELYVEAGGATAGDVDGDGKIALADAQKALKGALKIETLDAAAEAAADVDGDGKLTLGDAQKILRVALKIDEEF